MNELKYIIMIPKGFNKLGARAIIFNGLFVHSIVAKGFIEKLGWEVHSAGFLDFKNNKIKCYGKSSSLEVKSDPIFDRIIIKQTLEKSHPLFGFMD